MAQLFISLNTLASLGLAITSSIAIKKILKSLNIIPMDANKRNHILNNAKHGFNDLCGESCVNEVAKKIISKLEVGDQPDHFESKDYCKHGCLIAVRLGFSTKVKDWTYATSYHVGGPAACKALHK